MTKQELKAKTTEELKRLEAKLTRTIEGSAMLASDQLATLTATWQMVIAEIDNRKAKLESLTQELKVARAVYAEIKDLADYEPCPEAHKVLQEVVGRYNAAQAK